MTKEELDFIGAMNMCDEISNEAYKKIMCHCEEQEECEDCISRKSLLNKINAYVVGSQDKEFICKLIKEMPSVKPQEKTGYWITTYGNVRCSVCGNTKDGRSVGKATHYCDFCGARMEGTI